MKRILGPLVLIGALVLPCSAHAEYAQLAPSHLAASEPERDVKQCADAQTPAACQPALPACDRAVAALAKRAGTPSTDESLSRSLRDSARCKSMLGQHALAEGLLRRSLALQQKLHGPEHVEVAQELCRLSLEFIGVGDIGQADALARQSLAMRQRLLEPDHFDVADSLHALGLVRLEQGQYAQAEGLLRQAEEIFEKRLGRRDPRSAQCRLDIAYLLGEQAHYQESELLYREALLNLRESAGDQHQSVPQALNNLALILKRQGKFMQAELMYRETLTLLTAQYGAEHQYIAATLSNLAVVLVNEGKYEQAEVMFRRAIAVHEIVHGTDHPDVAAAVNNLGKLFLRQGKYDQAEPMIRRVLARTQKQLGSEHPNVAAGYSNLALALAGQGNYEEAEKLQRQSLALRQKLFGAEHPDIATTLYYLALVLRSQGMLQQAEAMHRQALAMQQKLLGADHPYVASILHGLAEVLAAQDRLPEALTYFRQAAEAREYGLRTATSETRMLAALDIVRNEEEVIYGLLLAHPEHPELQQLALATALLRKGRAAEAGGRVNQIVHQRLNDPVLREQFEKWQSVREKRESLIFGGLGKLTPEAYREQLAALAREADDLEGQLGQGLPELRELKPPPLDQVIAKVAARLPKHGALLEVIHTSPINLRAQKREPRWGNPHYLAITLSPNLRIKVYDLGMTEQLESNIQALLAAFRNPNSDPIPAAQALYRQVLAPVTSKGLQHLYLSLDAALNLVPFDALHDGKDYMVGRVSFHYLTSGRDMLRPIGPNRAHPALILADPDFGRSSDSATAARSDSRVNASAAARAEPDDEPISFYSRLDRLNRLPGAQKEATAVAQLLAMRPLLGVDATETAVREAKAPWVLHIASHGLFLHDQDIADTSSSSSRGVESLVQGARKLVAAANPSKPPPLPIGGGQRGLSRSALVLAGAAKGRSAVSATQDGLLTAEEARSLDLSGTQLVVLSACETGQGELSIGQGVFGLRRAFLVAGAETLVTSIWQVSDEVTGKLMERFYQRMLLMKHGRLRAMQEAMKDMRKQFHHPYYWAPFLVIGSDTPLRAPQTR